MSTPTQFAVYTNEAVYGVGATIEAAVAAAKANGFDSDNVVGHAAHDSYEGGIVDFTASSRVRADTEAVSGADGKIRRCSDALAAEVAANGTPKTFDIRADGVLDLDNE